METSGIINFSGKLAGTYISAEKSELLAFERETRINRLDKNEIYRFLGVESARMSLKVIEMFSEAVSVARTKSLNCSLVYFERANAELALLDGNSYLYAKLFYHSGWSFFFYLDGVYSKAVAQLNEGLELSEHLENKGAAFLAFRRILDQIPNLAKIHLKYGQSRQAYRLHNAMLKALIYKDFTSLPGKWNKHMFDYDAYTRQRGIDNVILNATKMILGFSKRERERVLYEIILKEIGPFEILNDHLEITAAFISLKRSFFLHEHSGFLSKLTQFLMLPMDTCFDILKLTLTGNYLDLAQRHMKDQTGFMEVCEKVNDYITFHLHLQPSEQFLLPMLHKEFPQLNQHNQSVYI